MERPRQFKLPDAPTHDPERKEMTLPQSVSIAATEDFFMSEGFEHRTEHPPEVSVVIWKKENAPHSSYIKIRNQACPFCGKDVNETRRCIIRYECAHAACLGCSSISEKSFKKCPLCTIDFTKHRPLDVGNDNAYSSYLKKKIGGVGKIEQKIAPEISSHKRALLKAVINPTARDYKNIGITIPQLFDHLDINDLADIDFKLEHASDPKFIIDATYLPKMGIDRSVLLKMHKGSKCKDTLPNVLASWGYTAPELASLGWTFFDLINDGLDKRHALEMFKQSKLPVSKIMDVLKTKTLGKLRITEIDLKNSGIPVDVSLFR